MKYIELLQTNNDIEVYRIFKNNLILVTKRCKIGKNGYISPKFLREINVLKCLSNPPKHLEDHIGRKHIIKIHDVYEEDGYLHFDMENATGNLFDLGKIINLSYIKEKILIDISDGLQYLHAFGFNHLDINLKNIVYIGNLDNLKFILIDFGNSVHINRINTYQTPTYYTMSYELVLMSKFKNYEMFFHRKSDIWSLGLLSYILHTDNLLTDGESIDSQYDKLDSILKNPELLNKDIYIQSNTDDSNSNSDNEIIHKTNLMLIIDPKYRPVLYFSNIHKIKNNHYNNTMTINKHLSKLINKLKFNQDFIIYSKNRTKQFKIILKWLLDHMYMNDVQTLQEIIQNIDITLKNDNFNFGNTNDEKIKNVNLMCKYILNSIDYKFEFN